VYLVYRQRWPELAEMWTHEDEFRSAHRRRSERIPDALVDTGSGLLAVEFGGSYSKQKLLAFHSYCERRSLPYEVW